MTSSTATRKLKIMLVEDSEHDLLIFMRSIQKSDLDAEIFHFPRAEEALKNLLSQPDYYDLVVSDFNLPGMNGLEFFRSIRKAHSGIPVIILTGSGSEELAVEALKAGVEDYMVKDPAQKYMVLLPLLIANVLKNHNDRVARAKAEELHRESEARFRAMMETIEGHIYVCSRDFRIEFMNRQLIERTGYDGTGELCYKVLHNRDSVCPWCVNDMVFSGKTVRWEICSSLDNKWYYVVNSPLVHADGTVSKQALFFDITERHNIEDALRNSEKKLSDILNFLPDITYAVDESGKIILWNHAAEDFTHAKAGDVLGKQFSDVSALIYGHSPPPLLELVLDPEKENKKLPEGVTKEGDLVFCDHFTLGGEHDNVYLSAKATTLYDSKGDIAGAVESVRNITHQKKTLDKLRLMQFSVDHASEMIMWADIDGRLTYANRQACECLGYTNQELLQRHVWDVDTEYSQDHYREHCKIIEQEKFMRFTSIYVRKDGSRFPVDISVSHGSHENTVMNFAFVRDITEQKLMEEKLQKANEELELRVNERTEELEVTVNMLQEAVTMLQQEITERVRSEEALLKIQEDLQRSSEDMYDLYNHAPCGYHSLDRDGYIVRMNDTELKWLGYERDEIIGKRKFTDLLTPDGVRTFQDTFPTLKAEGHVNDIEQVMIRKDGTLLPVILNATAIYDNDGNFIMTRSTVFDMTEIRQTEEKLRQSDRLMMQQSRQAAMGEMIGNIAHQWRQPLNTLGLLIQQLPCFFGTAEFNSKFIETYAEDSMKLIEHMSQTIDDFRNFFKPDREKVAFDVKKLIRKTITLVEASFTAQNISISTELEEGLQAVGYPNEYCQVLLTVLNNARDAFAGQKNRIANVRIRSFRENDHAVVTITDNAGGIDESVLDRIFEPYFTTKSPGSGTGIGLYMSRTIIENNMGGRLSARNTEEGAEFRIEIQVP